MILHINVISNMTTFSETSLIIIDQRRQDGTFSVTNNFGNYLIIAVKQDNRRAIGDKKDVFSGFWQKRYYSSILRFTQLICANGVM